MGTCVAEGLDFGVNNVDGGHSIGLINQLDVLKDVGGFGLEKAEDLNREQADLRVGVNAAAEFQKMPPGAGISGYENLGLRGVGKN